jgi:lipopolysaccharide transport system ATP-binding protein
VESDLGNCFVCELDELPLVPGRYRLDVEIRTSEAIQDALEGAAVFDVEEGTLNGRPVWSGRKQGDIAFSHRWIRPAD